MLKITTNEDASLRVEGRLAGDWVGELARVADVALADRGRVEVNVAGVTFADPEGVALLRDLRTRGAVVTDCSSFVSSLLDGGSQ